MLLSNLILSNFGHSKISFMASALFVLAFSYSVTKTSSMWSTLLLRILGNFVISVLTSSGENPYSSTKYFYRAIKPILESVSASYHNKTVGL
jgi:hypothetical protein